MAPSITLRTRLSAAIVSPGSVTLLSAPLAAKCLLRKSTARVLKEERCCANARTHSRCAQGPTGVWLLRQHLGRILRALRALRLGKPIRGVRFATFRSCWPQWARVGMPPRRRPVPAARRKSTRAQPYPPVTIAVPSTPNVSSSFVAFLQSSP